jgi:hypothetical protein
LPYPTVASDGAVERQSARQSHHKVSCKKEGLCTNEQTQRAPAKFSFLGATVAKAALRRPQIPLHMATTADL